MEQLQIEIDNAQSQEKASAIALKTIRKSFEITTMKYEEGFINYTSYLEIKKKLANARLEYLQAKMQYLFKTKILSYYLGN